MPTQHPRISVTKDPELTRALKRARDAIGEEVTEARLVHDLAVRGAQLVTGERTRRRAALERMADPDRGGLDLELLGQVEQIGMEDLPDPTSP